MKNGLLDPAPILALRGKRSISSFARELGVQRAQLVRWGDGQRITPFVAERLALELGHHPAELWSPWPNHDVEPGWEDRARCVGQPHWFFGETAKDAEVAKEICASCPSIVSCGEFAIANGIEHGVWGGMANRDRRKIARLRRLALQEAS